eukprot:UN2133
MNDSRYTHDEKLRLIDSGCCVLLEDYTLLNAWFQQQNRDTRLNGSWKICSLAVNGQSFLVISLYSIHL